ncbi:MAG: formate dehydrogenase subunit gamma [Nitrospiraceae bacterium]|nr:formate dehydrogenase subunit gamma [Nitrospiraceae bacterium]
MNNTGMIEMATPFERVTHWGLAISCILLTISGFGFVFKLEAIGAAFGGFTSMKNIHNWLGMVFIVCLLLNSAKWIRHALKFDADDFSWMLVAGGYLSHSVKVPPMGKLNTGQKLSYLGVLVSGIVLTVSGIIIWFFPNNKTWVLLSFFVHNLCFVFICIFMPIHLYLGTIGNPGTFQIMTNGRMPYWKAKKKHPKWIAEVEASGK